MWWSGVGWGGDSCSRKGAQYSHIQTLQFCVIFISFAKLQQGCRVLLKHLDIAGGLNHQQNKDAGVIIRNGLL